MTRESSKYETLSHEEFIDFLKGLGKITVDGRPLEASRTAFFTAFVRAFHSANENPKIFDDWMAERLLTSKEYAILEEMYYRRSLKGGGGGPVTPAQRRAIITASMRSGAGGGILSRARFTEDSLEKAVAGGVRQYVLLGAGLDTFALRRNDMLDRILVIEVDHPATQAIKRKRLAETGCSLPSSLHFVATDLSKENLAEALGRSCYDPAVPSFFSWIGVTYYLEYSLLLKVFRNLSAIAAPHSYLAFDYMDAAAFDSTAASPQVQRLRHIVKSMGEPMKTGFDPTTLNKELGRVGWKLRRNLSPEDIERIYFRGLLDRYRARKHIHLALASPETRSDETHRA